MELGSGKAGGEHRHELWQHVRRHRRDHADPQRSADQVPLQARLLHELVDRTKDLGSLGDGAFPRGGQQQPTGEPLHQRHPKAALELPDLAAERRLGYGTRVGRSPEVPLLGQSDEVRQLLQCRPFDYFRLSPR